MDRRTCLKAVALAALAFWSGGVAAHEPRPPKARQTVAAGPIGQKAAAVSAVTSIADEDSQERIRRALQERKLTIHQNDVALFQLVQEIAAGGNVNFIIDNQGLAEEGVTCTTRVSLEVRDKPVADVLDKLLKPLNLDHLIEDEVVKITGRVRAMGEPVLIVYWVGDVLDSPVDRGGAAPEKDLRKLADTLKKQIHPDLWEEVGGSGTVRPHAATASLIIRQVPPAHSAIQKRFAAMRTAPDAQ